MPDILITESIRGSAVDALAERFEVQIEPELWRNPEELAAKIANVHALIIRNQTQVTAELLQHAKALRVIGRAGVGLDNIDMNACTKAGIVITSTPDQNAISVAELAIGMMVCLARHIPAADADTKQGNWNRQRFMGTELYRKTLGILGAGKIGFLTASRARAFGMKVLAYDPFVSRDSVLLSELNAQLVSLDELLENSNVISCHLPSTPDTLQLLNASCFRKMKQGAFFINTSRGDVVDEAALLEALRSGKLAGAALDVRQKEPPVKSELEALPNVLLVPHIAALTVEAQGRVSQAVCEDVARVLSGQAPLNAVVKF
ncbi:MAG TPA: hydroxyacid dehydrogenase [Edaphobacter sp.]|nr:hydroxyacid dehydrogenase [Edaphobacter sp.]